MTEQPSGTKKERRLKLVQISADDILRMYNNQLQSVRVIPHGLPDDVKVEAVCYEFMVDAFLLRVSHPSFDIVEEGYAIPKFEGNAIVEMVPHG